MNDIGLDLNEERIYSLKRQWKLGISIIKKTSFDKQNWNKARNF